MSKITPTKLQEPMRDAIEAQRARLWHLRSLLDCVKRAVLDDRQVADLEAALDGLIAMADEIDMGLEPDALERKATEIADAARREAERSIGDVLPDAEGSSGSQVPKSQAVN